MNIEQAKTGRARRIPKSNRRITIGVVCSLSGIVMFDQHFNHTHNSSVHHILNEWPYQGFGEFLSYIHFRSHYSLFECAYYSRRTIINSVYVNLRIHDCGLVQCQCHYYDIGKMQILFKSAREILHETVASSLSLSHR